MTPQIGARHFDIGIRQLETTYSTRERKVTVLAEWSIRHYGPIVARVNLTLTEQLRATLLNKELS